MLILVCKSNLKLSPEQNIERFFRPRPIKGQQRNKLVQYKPRTTHLRSFGKLGIYQSSSRSLCAPYLCIMSELIFDTKENNNRRRQEEFLKLTPDERFRVFLKMVDGFTKFHTNAIPEDKGNFVLTKDEGPEP